MQKNMVIAMLIILIILIGVAYIISERENEKLTLQNRRLLKRLERKDKTDCKFYNAKSNTCTALKKLYCECGRSKCKFYKMKGTEKQ